MVKVGWYRFGGLKHFIDSGYCRVSGDPGFAWMAFPVKLRVVPGDVAGWPWSWVPHGVCTGVPRSRQPTIQALSNYIPLFESVITGSVDSLLSN